ncbi:MAG TPA: cation:proton antiporter [Thermoanaerobaculia bacterium]|nr:cation:proton antiporter [Thermoanaerobaculia bacterium]
MEHGASLITTLATAFGLALVLGFLAARVKLPPLVGYLLAGILLGPHTRGFTADVALAGQLAEIGVMLLMFGVGLHFSFDDLLAVKGMALPGAIVQMAASTALGTASAMFWGWSFGAGLMFGLALSVASTVVLLRALEARGQLETFNGRVAVGWLIVQDMVMVLILVLLPPLAGAGEGSVGTSLVLTFAKVGTFIVLMLVVGRRVFPRVLWLVAKTGSRELFTLCVIAAAVGIAYGAARLFGVSFALGAFFAGMLLGESALSQRAADESLPLRDAFAVLFFVSVGMLFDPMVVVREPLGVLAVMAIVMIGNPLAAMILVLLFRYPLNTAVTIGVSLAQIGEFSFILAGLGTQYRLLPAVGQDLILAAAILSIALNPALFAAIQPAQRWMRARSELARRLERRADPLAELPMSVDSAELTGHVAIVGYGRVGRRVALALAEQQIPFTIAEENRELVEKLRERNMHAVSGNASDPAVLIQAHVARAAMLVIATPDTVDVRKMVDVARQLNPKIDIVLRTHSDDVAELLRGENLGTVFMGEHELAKAITRHVIDRMHDAAAAKNIEEPV